MTTLHYTRRWAAEAGDVFYQGKDCPKGHKPTMRYTSCGNCVQCVKAKSAAYQKGIRALLANARRQVVL